MTTQQTVIKDSTPSTAKEFPSSKAPQLRPYHFKKGQSGNPNGRPKAVISKHERLELLSEIARQNRKKGNPVEAIRTINEMLGDNAPVQHDWAPLIELLSSLRGYKPKELLGPNQELLAPAQVIDVIPV